LLEVKVETFLLGFKYKSILVLNDDINIKEQEKYKIDLSLN